MRKSDMEWVEMLLEPLRTAKDRLDVLANEASRKLADLQGQVRDLERDRDANSLAVEQACNSARSLLQQANRKLRAAKLIDEEEGTLDDPLPGSNALPSPAVHRTASGRGVI